MRPVSAQIRWKTTSPPVSQFVSMGEETGPKRRNKFGLIESTMDDQLQGSAPGGKAMATINGTNAADILYGTPGADWIDGKRGDDRIHGRRGDDQILGGAGNDGLRGE